MISLKKANINLAELSTILYYADFLSLKHSSTTVTDSCKYFFIHGVPMNICFIAGVEPLFDWDNVYLLKSLEEYLTLRNKFGDDGVMSFINNICNLGVAGAVNAILMLKYIHYYSNRELRNAAFKKYKEFKKNYLYKMPSKDEDDRDIEIECTKYVAHVNAKKYAQK